MANESTKAQIRIFLEEAIKKAQNPDPLEKIKKERERRMKKIEKNYGF